MGITASHRVLLCAAFSLVAGAVRADIVVDFTQAVDPSSPAAGLSARATFDIDGDKLTVLLENTTNGYQNLLQPSFSRDAENFLTSLGFELSGGTTIESGDSAVLGNGSTGVGRWANLRNGGRRIEREWTWTNDGGADQLSEFDQVLTTLSRHDVGQTWRFDGSEAGRVRRSWGGIAPLGVRVSDHQRAVANAILFTMTLSGPLEEFDLLSVARSSIVEFGAGRGFLQPQSIPAPGALLLGFLGASCVTAIRRRRA